MGDTVAEDKYNIEIATALSVSGDKRISPDQPGATYPTRARFSSSDWVSGIDAEAPCEAEIDSCIGIEAPTGSRSPHWFRSPPAKPRTGHFLAPMHPTGEGNRSPCHQVCLGATVVGAGACMAFACRVDPANPAVFSGYNNPEKTVIICTYTITQALWNSNPPIPYTE